MVINGENILQQRAQELVDWLEHLNNNEYEHPHHLPGNLIFQQEAANMNPNENFYPSNHDVQCAYRATFVASKKLFPAVRGSRQILLETMFYLAQHAVVCPNTMEYLLLTDYWDQGLMRKIKPAVVQLRNMHKVVEVYLRDNGQAGRMQF